MIEIRELGSSLPKDIVELIYECPMRASKLALHGNLNDIQGIKQRAEKSANGRTGNKILYAFIQHVFLFG